MKKVNIMTEAQIAFHYKSSLVFVDYVQKLTEKEPQSEHLINALFHEMMNYGYIPSSDFSKAIVTMDVEKVYKTLIPILQESVGANVEHKPMYPNFPEQVRNMSDHEWIINALIHYWSMGSWMPGYEKEFRKSELEPNIKYKVVDIITREELNDFFNKLIQSPDSLTSFDKECVQWVFDNPLYEFKDVDIPFAETRCILMANYLKANDIHKFNQTLNNMTDILRVCTYMSKGDISLAQNTKFINFSRPQRRFLTSSLEIFWDNETAYRHKNKWIKLLHSLHVGDYSSIVWEKAKLLRENHKIETFNSLVEGYIKDKKYYFAITLLKQRPSEFARRLDHLLREMCEIAPEQAYIVNKEFKKVVADVPTKILVQLYGHFNNRDTNNKKVVLPKGQLAKAVLIEQPKEILGIHILELIKILVSEFKKRFIKLGENSLGKVWLDNDLNECPVPSGMRSISDGLVTVPRGTKFNLSDDNTIRMFIYWVGARVDIDLSATFYDEKFVNIGQVDFTHLRNSEFNAVHSGDITSAPEGASEFIDLDIPYAVKNDARYVLMSVLSYSLDTFDGLEEVFVGYMTRSKPNSNEIYDPKTVKHKLNLVNKTKYVCPLMFDLVNRQVIFVDMTKRISSRTHNTVQSNAAGIEDILESMVKLNKMSLYDLFWFHVVSGRGEFTDDKSQADFTFGLEDCDITPKDWLEIQTDWIG